MFNVRLVQPRINNLIIPLTIRFEATSANCCSGGPVLVCIQALGTWSTLVILLYPCLQLALAADGLGLPCYSLGALRAVKFTCGDCYRMDMRGAGELRSSLSSRQKHAGKAKPFVSPSHLASMASPTTQPTPYQAGCGV
jgi:hypothetical protein